MLNPINTVHKLERTCAQLGSHYFDEDTKKFFGSKVLDVRPTADGAIFRESMRKPGWICVRRLVIKGEEHDFVDIYKADNTPANARTARRIFDTCKDT